MNVYKLSSFFGPSCVFYVPPFSAQQSTYIIDKISRHCAAPDQRCVLSRCVKEAIVRMIAVCESAGISVCGLPDRHVSAGVTGTSSAYNQHDLWYCNVYCCISTVAPNMLAAVAEKPLCSLELTYRDMKFQVSIVVFVG